jgi:hypothetical protein
MEKERNFIQLHTEASAMRKEKTTVSSQGIVWEDVLLKVHLTRAILHSCIASRRATAATTGTTDRWAERGAPMQQQQHMPQQEIRKTGLAVQAPHLPNNDMLKVTTVDQQSMTELSEVVSEKDKIIIITKMTLNLMKQWLLEFIGSLNL